MHVASRLNNQRGVLAATLILSLLIGISLGLLGGGGSILTVPILTYVAGMPAKDAIMSAMLVVAVTSAVGLVSRARGPRVAILVLVREIGM